MVWREFPANPPNSSRIRPTTICPALSQESFRVQEELCLSGSSPSWRAPYPRSFDPVAGLFVYFCLNANRRTGQMKITHGDLAKAVGRSRRSIIIYMEELQRQNVCRVQTATNQHASGQIEICDAFWPYEKARKEEATQDRASYIAQIQHLMGSRQWSPAHLLLPTNTLQMLYSSEASPSNRSRTDSCWGALANTQPC